MVKESFGKTVFDTSIKKIKGLLEKESKGVFLKDVLHKKEYPIIKTPFIIGRSEDCALTITDDIKVSRIHCVINQRGDKYILEDLGSTNGILLNEHPIKKGLIKHGDVITVGDKLYLFINKQ